MTGASVRTRRPAGGRPDERAPRPVRRLLPQVRLMAHLADAGAVSAEDVLGYQGLVGNQAVQRLVNGSDTGGPAMVQRDYLVPPYARDLSTHFAGDEYSALRAAIADYQRLSPGASANARRPKLQKVVEAYAGATKRSVPPRMQPRMELLRTQIVQAQALLSGGSGGAAPQAQPTEQQTLPLPTEPTAVAAQERPRALATQERPRAVATQERPAPIATQERPPARATQERPRAVPQAVQRPDNPTPSSAPTENARAQPPQAQPPSGEQSQAYARKLAEVIRRAQADDTPLDTVVALLKSLRAARDEANWEQRVPAGFSDRFDAHVEKITERVKAAGEWMKRTRQLLQEAEARGAAPERVTAIRTRLEQVRAQPGWATRATAAFTSDFDARLGSIRVPTPPAQQPATQAVGQPAQAVTRGAHAPAGAQRGPAKQPETMTATTVPAEVRAPAHRPPAQQPPWVADPVNYLTSELGMVIVRPGDRSVADAIPKAWSTDELKVVARVFSVLGDDRRALRGVGLVRVAEISLVNPGGRRDDQWVTEALFGYQYKVNTVAGNWLKVSDPIFRKLQAAPGEASEGELAIAHEGGHALETLLAREKSWAWEAARITYNQAAVAYDHAYAAYMAAYDADDTGVGPAVQAATRVEQQADADKEQARATLRQAEAAYYAVFSQSRQQSHRLLNFIRFVNGNSIPPDLTAYAAAQWPQTPREFYGEAYAYFVLNPARLKQHSQALYGFFASGGHLDDARPG